MTFTMSADSSLIVLAKFPSIEDLRKKATKVASRWHVWMIYEY